ncbi:MAG: SulP family inorganic anion transporter [Xanthomonadales bacterium]|nr:SulP family inorganic anion transporter [Xanthomonadales bacterium]
MRATKSTLSHIKNPFELPQWWSELKDRDVLKRDFIAGLTVALVLIPQSMAYAQLAGLPAHYGLYASLLPPIIAAFFGSSRQLATGPVAMVSLMTAAALEPLATAGGEAFIGYAILLAFMVGLFQLVLGMFRLGVLLNFLSHPVVLGFVNAAAIIIATSQLGKIFGVSAEKGEHHYEYVINIIRAAMENTHLPTLGMAVIAFSIMYAVLRYKPRYPAVLITVVITTILAWLFGFAQHTTVKLEQINDPKIRIALVYDAIQAKHTANLRGRYIAAQQEYEALAGGAEQENEAILAARQQLEQIALRLEQLKEEGLSHHKELFATSLYQIGQGEHKKFYTREEISHIAGEKSKIYFQDWHIQRYENDMVDLQAGGQVIGKIPSGLPGFRMPSFDLSAITHLVGAMVAISLIGFMEAISIAKAMAARTRQSLNTDRELIGQGMSNIIGSLFQSYPVSGSFSRSAVNINAGAVTGFSSAITVLAVATTLLFLTPLLYYLPQATLAVVIMVAVAGLVKFRPMVHTWQANRHDGVVTVVAFVLTLALAPELEMGILFGMLLSLALLLFRMMTPRVAFPAHDLHLLPAEAVAAGALDDGTIVRMRFEGSLVFANVAFFEEQLQKMLASTPDLKVLIIDGVSIREVDASGNEMLREYFRRLTESGISVLFTRLRAPIMEVFKRSHMFDDIGMENFHRKPPDVFRHAWELVNAERNPQAEDETEETQAESD